MSRNGRHAMLAATIGILCRAVAHAQPQVIIHASVPDATTPAPFTSACPDDADCDGVPDLFDVCPLVPDPQQEDDDQDSVGDACDGCPADPYNDDDIDGICGYDDNCVSTFNPGQEDGDGDFQGDACDFDDGVIMLGWSGNETLTWQQDAQYGAFNLYRRNIADLQATGVYVLDPAAPPGPLDERSCSIPSDLVADELPAPGEAVAYFMTGTAGRSEGSLGTASDGTERLNSWPCGCNRPSERVLQGWDGPETPQTLLIDNLADWCAFRPEECGSGLIDFTTHVAVVAAAGWKPSSCHELRITCVQQGMTPSDVRVAYDNIRYMPQPPCGCTFALVYPFDVVKIPRPVTGAVFTERALQIGVPCH